MRRITTLSALLAALAVVASGLGLAPASSIVGGSTVPDDRYAFMASVQVAGEDGTAGHFCGGSVVDAQWVLTAAHCMVDTNPQDIQVMVGATDIDDGTGQVLTVDQIVVHPDYEDTGTFDAALIHTTSAMDAPAIALAGAEHDALEAEGTPLTVAGWGTEVFGSPVIPSDLKSVEVAAVADENCTTNTLMGFAADSEICAEALLGDSCQGDSGGPLFSEAGGQLVQVGIVSYGLGCATPEFPGVYGEVNNPSIHDFITSHLTGSAPAPGEDEPKGNNGKKGENGGGNGNGPKG